MPNVEQNRPLSLNKVVLFPSPIFLHGGATKLMQDTQGKKSNLQFSLEDRMLYSDSNSPEYKKSFKLLIDEYFSILNALKENYDNYQIAIVKNQLVFYDDILKKAICQKLSDVPGFTNVTLKNKQSNNPIEQGVINDTPTVWTRDGFTSFDDFTLINPKYFDKNTIPESDSITYSYLAEGGSVLTMDKIVLISENLWNIRNKDKGYHRLIKEGYCVEPLPLVNEEKQKYGFEPNHIDGHISLIKNKNNEIFLLVEKSYFEQGDNTSKKICSVARNINAKIRIVDDTKNNLPNLPLNLIQAEDTSIITSNKKNQNQRHNLLDVLQNEVGVKKVITTSVAIENIPESLFGSIRCLTNFPRIDFLQQIIV